MNELESAPHALEPSEREPRSIHGTNARRELDEGIWTLIYGVLAPPLFTLLNYQITSSLAPWACTADRASAVHLVSLVILGLVILAGLESARYLKKSWDARAISSVPGLMSMAGVLESAAFATVIVTNWLPFQYLAACQ